MTLRKHLCAIYIDTDTSICICLIVSCIFLPVAVPNVLQSKAIAGLQDSPLLSLKVLLEHLVGNCPSHAVAFKWVLFITAP